MSGSDISHYKDLFIKLEEMEKSQKIESFGVTQTTLEDVFIKITKEKVIEKSENSEKDT